MGCGLPIATSFPIATYRRLCILAAAAGNLQQADELGQLGPAQVPEELDGQVLNDRVHFFQQLKSSWRDLGPDHTAVVLVALLADKLESLEPGEQAGNIGLGGDHAVADSRTGEAVRLRTAQDAQDVVLGGGDAP